jgi:hypothetical protein
MIRKLAVLILVFVSALSFSEDQQRRPWYIGFGAGTFFDAAWVTDGDELTWDDFYEGADTSPPICINFKVGGTLSPNVLLGFDATAIREEGSGSALKISTQFTNLFAMLTWFPFQKGLFVRLGGGFSVFRIEVDDDYYGKSNDDYNGYGALAGIGYAFWLGKHFNLTLNVDHSRQFYSDPDGPDNSRFTILYVGFDWY